MLISILFLAFMILMVVIAIGTSLIQGLFDLLFGRFTPTQFQGHTKQSRQSKRQSQSQQPTSPENKKRDKIFDKSEGEYVDFEEIQE